MCRILQTFLFHFHFLDRFISVGFTGRVQIWASCKITELIITVEKFQGILFVCLSVFIRVCGAALSHPQQIDGNDPVDILKRLM